MLNPVLITLLLSKPGQLVIKLLTALVTRPVVLGIAIASFSLTGITLIVLSALVVGWWQAFLLGLGTSLLLTGTVEIGILSVLNHLLHGGEPERSQPVARGATAAADHLDLAVALRELAARLGPAGEPAA